MKKTRYSPGHLPALAQSEEDEIMIKIIQEHVGYNCPVIIDRRFGRGLCKIEPCKDYPNGKILFGEHRHRGVTVTLEQAYKAYCNKHGIIPF